MSSEAEYARSMRCDVVYCEALSSTTPIGERIRARPLCLLIDSAALMCRQRDVQHVKVCEKESGELTLGWSVHAAKE